MPVYGYGAPLDQAAAAMIMIHGRGATPADILSLAQEFGEPGVAYLAPEAAGGQWYPYPFTAPVEQNEPWLSSALAAVGDVFDMVAEAGIPPERTMLLGFSQGACLALEYAARNPRRYGGVIGLSGALIGWNMPEERVKQYEEGVRNGGILMGLRAKNDEDAEHFERSWTAANGQNVAR